MMESKQAISSAVMLKVLLPQQSILDRTFKIVSLSGLLGLIGAASVFEPDLARFSYLSFLSYTCYLRLIPSFVDPPSTITGAEVVVPYLGATIPFVFLPLAYSFPMFGLIGFAGFSGLCYRSGWMQVKQARPL